MGAISGHDLTLSRDCATPGCAGEADASGLCPECRRPTKNGKGNVRFERTGLVVDGELDDEELLALIRRLGRMENAIRWWLGDALLLVKNRWPKDGPPSFGATWDGILEELGLLPATGAHYRRVARDVPIERRRAGLSWSHHERVAKLPPDEQEKWLDRCEKEGLSVHHLHVATRVVLMAPTDPAPDVVLVQTRLIAPADRLSRNGVAPEF